MVFLEKSTSITQVSPNVTMYASKSGRTVKYFCDYSIITVGSYLLKPSNLVDGGVLGRNTYKTKNLLFFQREVLNDFKMLYLPQKYWTMKQSALWSSEYVRSSLK